MTNTERRMRMENIDFNTSRPGITHFELYQDCHQLLVLLVDISGSMNDVEEGETNSNIQLAEEMINQIGLGEELPDEYKRTTDLIIITFNNDVEILYGPAPLSQYRQGIRLKASGGTSFYGAIRRGLEVVRTTQDAYRKAGIRYRRSQMFIFSDGLPTDEEKSLSSARELCRTTDVSISNISMPGGSPKAALALTEDHLGDCKAKIHLYLATDCRNGLPELSNFIQATVIAFSDSVPGDQVVLELPDHLLTAQDVVKREDGTREVRQDSVVFH